MFDFASRNNVALYGFPPIPEGIEAKVVNAETARAILGSGQATVVIKLRGQPTTEMPYLALGQPGATALEFARSCKRFYTLITNPRGVDSAPHPPPRKRLTIGNVHDTVHTSKG